MFVVNPQYLIQFIKFMSLGFKMLKCLKESYLNYILLLAMLQ